MNWETPTIEDFACGMEVTSYAPATEALPKPALMEQATDEPSDDAR